MRAVFRLRALHNNRVDCLCAFDFVANNWIVDHFLMVWGHLKTNELIWSAKSPKLPRKQSLFLLENRSTGLLTCFCFDFDDDTFTPGIEEDKEVCSWKEETSLSGRGRERCSAYIDVISPQAMALVRRLELRFVWAVSCWKALRAATATVESWDSIA